MTIQGYLDRFANVLRAVEWANSGGLTTFALTGMGGGRLRRIAKLNLHVPSNDMGAVESAHLTVFHHILDELTERFKVAP